MKVGDILKFSEKGLKLWISGRRGFFEPRRYQIWRWRVIGISKDLDVHNKPMLILMRIDRKYPIKETWSPMFFEVES
jgi:hypothetical protein